MPKKKTVIQMTLEEFTNLYSTPYLKGKYGEDWVALAIDEQSKRGIHIQIVEKVTPAPSPSPKPTRQFNSLDLT